MQVCQQHGKRARARGGGARGLACLVSTSLPRTIGLHGTARSTSATCSARPGPSCARGCKPQQSYDQTSAGWDEDCRTAEPHASSHRHHNLVSIVARSSNLSDAGLEHCDGEACEYANQHCGQEKADALLDACIATGRRLGPLDWSWTIKLQQQACGPWRTMLRWHHRSHTPPMPAAKCR